MSDRDRIAITQGKTPTVSGEGFLDKARSLDLLQAAIGKRESQRFSSAIKTKASPGEEAFLDKAPGGGLWQPAIVDRRSNTRPRKNPHRFR